MIAIAAVGLPSQSKTVTSKTTKRTDNSISSVKETLCVYDCITGVKLGSHRMEGNLTAGLSASTDRGIFTTRLNKATMATFCFGKEQPNLRFAAPEAMEAIQLSSDGLYVAAGGAGNGMVYVWEVESGQMLCAFKAHYRKVTTIAFSEDDAVLVTGGEDAMVHFWDFTSLVMLGGLGNVNNAASSSSSSGLSPTALLRTISACKTTISQVSVLGLAGTTSSVAIASLDHTVRVVAAHSGREVFAAALPTALLSVCIDVDNVYCGGANGTVYVIKDFASVSATSASHALTGHEGAVTCVQRLLNTTSTQQVLLLTGSEDSTLRWWDVATLSQLRVVRMEGACPVRSLAVLGEADYVNDLVKRSGGGRRKLDAQPLKKVKEADQWDRAAQLNNVRSAPTLCEW